MSAHCQRKLADQITQAQWAAKYQEAQATATRATKLELDRSYDAAFTAYLAAAQTYLFLVRHTTDAASKANFRALSAKLVERAERIKLARKQDIKPVQRDPLSIEEQDSVLQRGAIVCGRRLKRWTGGDRDGSGAPAPALPALSPAQQSAQCSWVRYREALPGACMLGNTVRGSDVVQDNVTDCSVVAALIVAAEHHARHRSKLALSCLFPQDESGLPVSSPDGRYCARFLVNETWRQVHIDDRLPVSASGQPMFASTRKHDQLWPALIEKAYLSLMGGYDFSGSNSANDLYVMSGWLPETISLRSAFRSEAAWQRIHSGFSLGHCVLTVGTGKAIEEGSSWSGLVSSHDYAVIDVREERGVRQLVVVNPWRSGENGSEPWTAGLRRALDDAEGPQTLVVDWDALPAHFASLHVNWDPTTFDYSAAAHLSAPASTAGLSSTASKHRHSKRMRLQVEPNPSLPSEVWLFLARHTGAPLDKGEYIGLSVSRCSEGTLVSDEALQLNDKTAMHDNQYDLYRFMPDAGATSFDVIVSHEGRDPDFCFTLSAYSNSRVKISNPPAPLPYAAKATGSWTASTAGGNHTCHTFLTNPQYSLTIKSHPGAPAAAKASLEVVGETDKNSPINVKLLFRGGARVADFESRDVIAGGSTYAHGRTSCTARDLAPGSYTLVVSSFQPRHLASFSLVVRSSLPVELVLIPAEGAGMYARQVRGAWEEGTDGGRGAVGRNPRFALRVTKPTSVKIRLQTPASPHPIALSLFAASPSGEPSSLVASSGAYSDAVCGVLLPLTRLEPAEHGYLIVPSTFQAGVHADFAIALYADAPVTLAAVQ
ncbi:hypothetical protein DMC30DRAFT_447194 [Rhodotorula diobovata]|uniref:Calpain catalytic domain-containing protein n=1 Tax=Rhodotorula diobovata TaxID=5288 RepID=A0A5C5FU02_9BASI|nr:hypothetical protein DMC30DRAFT_447194 [Rhodotorula diobovata]